MKDKMIVVRGVLHWAKLMGEARPHTGMTKYDKGPYWSVDISPDRKSREIIKEAGIEGKLRKPADNDERTETFLSLRVLETKKDGSKNPSPRIIGADGKPWEDGLIGNGSVGDIKIKVVDYGAGSDKGSYLQAVRILDHVPYVSQDFAPLDTDDEFFATPETASEDDGDEIPF